MSLINDVLRDLERRGDPDAPRALPPVDRPARRGRPWVWWVLAAAGAGVLLHWSLGGTPSRDTSDSALVATNSPDPASGETPVEPAASALNLMPRPALAAGAPASPEPDSDPALKRISSQAPETLREDEPQTGPSEPERATRTARETATPTADRLAAAAQANAGLPETHEPVSTDTPAPTEPQRKGTQESRSESTQDTEIVIRRSGGREASASGEDRLARAKRALGRGQRALAESTLRELLEARPGSVDARLLLARLYIEDGRPRAAGNLLEAGLENQPDETALAYLLGRLLLEQDRLSEARTVLADHAPAVHNDPDHHLLLALAHRQSGDHEAAISVYREVTEASPGSGAAWVGLGVSLEATGDNPGARAAYQEAVGGDDRRAAVFARQRLAVMPASPEAEEH